MNLKKLFDIDLPDNYISFQGFTITDDYFIVSSISSSDNTILSFYDKNTYKYLFKIDEYNFGHANDLSYNKELNYLYIINNDKIEIIDLSSFERKEPIQLERFYYTISYNNDLQMFYLSDAKIVDIYDNNMKKINSFSVNNTQTGQGTSTYNNNFYFSYYESGMITFYQKIYDGKYPRDSNLIYVYNNNGELQSTLVIKPGYGEIESIEFYNDEMYLFFNNFENNKGIMYKLDIPEKESKVSLKIPIISENVKKTTAYLLYNDNIMETAYSNNNYYVFTNLLIKNNKIYNYMITQQKDDYIIIDNNPIYVTITNIYNPIENDYEYNINYSRKYFINIDKRLIGCKKYNDSYFDKDGQEINKEEFDKKFLNNNLENRKIYFFSVFIVLSFFVISYIAYILKNKKYKRSLK